MLVHLTVWFLLAENHLPNLDYLINSPEVELLYSALYGEFKFVPLT